MQRLKEGKVYVPELAAQASHNFFRKGNLLALRELALRRTAERVDEQMQQYREVKGVKNVWPAADRILVCVGPNPSSIRRIRAAKRMAAGLKAEWIAVYVEAPHKVKPSENDLRQLTEHMRLAESLGAETITLSGHKASDEILSYARERNVTKIIVGKPTHPLWKDKVFGSMLDAVVRGVVTSMYMSYLEIPQNLHRDRSQKQRYQSHLRNADDVEHCYGQCLYRHSRPDGQLCSPV